MTDDLFRQEHQHSGKIGNCRDLDGKKQHCLENGCLCFTCQLTGEHCAPCPGPIRCGKPRMKCKEYVGGDIVQEFRKKATA